MNKKFSFYDYFSTSNWEIIDRKTCHWYDDAETEIEVVEVVIGQVCEVTATYPTRTEKSPIIRWMSLKSYENFIKKEGQIVW